MSTEQETIVQPISDDLETFSADFFGQKNAPAAQPVAEIEVEEIPLDAPKDGTPTDDTSEESTENEDEDEVVEEQPKPKPKNRFQERIDELTAKQREAERKAQDLEAKLAKLEQTSKPEPVAPVAAVEDTGPAPDDINEDGTDKYPLGEFDPHYIRDLTKFAIAQEREELKVKDQREAQQRELDTAKATLQTEWQTKLGPAKERYPDFVDKGQQLLDTFEGIDQRYGEYLESTIMSMEYGTDVLYYLANNPDEAQKIVQSGATKATIALGRLESKFMDFAEEKQKARPKVSAAPTPPTHVNKGSSVSKANVAPDTDDLDAFESAFFTKSSKRKQ